MSDEKRRSRFAERMHKSSRRFEKKIAKVEAKAKANKKLLLNEDQNHDQGDDHNQLVASNAAIKKAVISGPSTDIIDDSMDMSAAAHIIVEDTNPPQGIKKSIAENSSADEPEIHDPAILTANHDVIKVVAELEKSHLQPKTSSKSAASIRGFAANKSSSGMSASEVTKKIITRLEVDQELRTVSRYLEAFRQELSDDQDARLSLVFMGDRQSDKLQTSVWFGVWPSGLSAGADTNSAVKIFPKQHKVAGVWIGDWHELNQFSPQRLGSLHSVMDVCYIESLPESLSKRDSAELLQRLVSSGALIIIDQALAHDITRLHELCSRDLGYISLTSDHIQYINFGDLNAIACSSQHNERLGHELRDYARFRRIARIGKELLGGCGEEIARQEFFKTVKASDDKHDSQLVSLESADHLMKSAQMVSKTLIADKAIVSNHIDSDTKPVNETSIQVALGLLTDLSVNDLVREDELDLLKFNKEDRHLLSRFIRFRFASNFSYIWKLNPDYISRLHSDLLDVIKLRTRTKYREVSSKMSNAVLEASIALAPSSPEFVETKLRKINLAWKSENSFVDQVAAHFSVSDFRSLVFSKRNGAAPVEAQGGVVKELKESRMFVSQLMAFGMLGAMLFGSVYAVDVFTSWFSGQQLEVGSELTEAAKNSRSLGRQVRILIAGVAGVGIVLYLILRLYLKKPEALLEKQKILQTYNDQLEDVVANYVDSSYEYSKALITSKLDLTMVEYERLRESMSSNGSGPSDDKARLSGRTLGASPTAKKYEVIQKWLASLMFDRDSYSLVKSQAASLTSLKSELEAE